MLYHILYICTAVNIALFAAPNVVGKSGTLALTIGVLGIWRYSWGILNFIRAKYYMRFAFPRRRRRAEALYALQTYRAHAFFLVTTYKIDPAITAPVYRSIFEAARNSEGGATIVASVVDASDVRLIKAVFAGSGASRSGSVSLVFDRIAGTGKRDALATSLRTIRRLNPTRHDMIFLVDGDTRVPASLVAKSAPFFTDEKMGALTSDEVSDATGGRLFQDWFHLRFAQRQLMMSSMGLSERVLTLTGRMSVFRGDLATQPGFISGVQHDFIDHWRFGRVNFLTGDDKSTWFWLLKHGYKMGYLPDVKTVSVETQPRDSFYDSAIVLMRRWFGNTLRTSNRALALPASRIGYFTWWSILDQRMSMWTTLAGPCGMLLAAYVFNPFVFLAYLAWVMVSRYVMCTMISTFRAGGFPVTYPFLLYFGQIGGALVKTYVLFRLDRQKWTRQNTATGTARQEKGFLGSDGFSLYLHALAVAWLILGMIWFVDISGA